MEPECLSGATSVVGVPSKVTIFSISARRSESSSSPNSTRMFATDWAAIPTRLDEISEY